MKIKLLMAAAIMICCSGVVNAHYSPDLNENGFRNADIEKYVKEGKRQYAEVLEHNRLNNERGCPEQNVYFFSADVTDNWIDYILLNGGAPDILSSESFNLLHNELSAYNLAHPDKTIYVCLTSMLSLEVSSLWTGKTSIDKLVEHYKQEGLGGDENSATKVADVGKQWKEIVSKISGKVPNENPNYPLSGSGYTKYSSSANRLLLATARIHASTFDKESNTGRSMFAYMHTKEVKGLFNTHSEQLENYISSYTGTYSTALERNVLASVEFIEDNVYDPANAQANSTIGGMSELYDLAIVKPNTNPSDAGDLAMNDTYIYDYAGVLSGTENETIRQQISNEISGTAVYASTKLKFYITDADSPASTRTLIENINLSDPVHDNSLIVWIDLKSSAEMKVNVRYADDLKNIYQGHGLHSYFKSYNINSLVSTALAFSPIGGLIHFKSLATYLRQASSIVSTFLTEHKIPEHWYNITHADYNSKWKTIFSIMCPAMYAADLLIGPLLTVAAGSVIAQSLNGGELSDVAFAFVCGIYNGFVNELAGISDIIKLMAGAFVNQEDRNALTQLINTICSKQIFSLIWKQVKENHTGLTNPYQLAEQIGKDVIFVCIAFVPIAGALGVGSKLGKLSKFITVCTKVANVLDKLNPIFYALKAASFTASKVGAKTMVVVRIVAGQAKELFKVVDNVVTVGAQFWKNTVDQFAGGITEWVVMTKMGINSLNLQLKVPGYTINPIPEFILFMKRVNPDGSPKLDANGNPEIGVGSQSAIGIIEAIKNQLMSNFGLPESLALAVAELPSAIKLYNNAALKNAIDALPSGFNTKFFESLKAGGLADAPAAHIGKHIEEMTESTVEAWNGLRNAKEIIRNNFNTLSKAEDLISAGFIKADLEKIASVGNKLIQRYSDDVFAKTVCDDILEAMKNAKNKGYDLLGVNIRLHESFQDLINSVKFKNSKADIQNLSAQLRITTNTNPGFIEQINEGLRRILLNPAHSVYIESAAKLGDIVDETTSVAIQLKALISVTSAKVSQRLTQAVKQFTSEVPPNGYSKIAEVRVLSPNNPVYNFSLAELKNYLQTGVNNLSPEDLIKYQSMDKIRLQTGLGTKNFKIDSNGLVIEL